MKVLEDPLSYDQAVRMMKKHPEKYIRGVIAIDLGSIIGWDEEHFLDVISTKLTGTELLQDINYRIVGHESPSTLFLEVEGDPKEALEFMHKKGPREWHPHEEK